MGTKTVTLVRYAPPNELVGRREIGMADWKRLGILTQKKPVVWEKKSGFWVDADEAKISPEALAWLEDKANHLHKNEFTVETQEVDDGEDEEAPADDSDTSTDVDASTAADTGESKTGSTGTASRSTTTTSTAGTRRGSRT